MIGAIRKDGHHVAIADPAPPFFIDERRRGTTAKTTATRRRAAAHQRRPSSPVAMSAVRRSDRPDPHVPWPTDEQQQPPSVRLHPSRSTLLHLPCQRRPTQVAPLGQQHTDHAHHVGHPRSSSQAPTLHLHHAHERPSFHPSAALAHEIATISAESSNTKFTSSSCLQNGIPLIIVKFNYKRRPSVSIKGASEVARNPLWTCAGSRSSERSECGMQEAELFCVCKESRGRGQHLGKLSFSFSFYFIKV